MPRWMPISGIGLLIIVAGLLGGEHPRLAAVVAVDRTWCAGRGPRCARHPGAGAAAGRFHGGCSGHWDYRRFVLRNGSSSAVRFARALTIGVVYVAMAIGIGLGSIITTTVGDVRSWYRQTLQGDFFLRRCSRTAPQASRSWCPTHWKKKSAVSPV